MSNIYYFKKDFNISLPKEIDNEIIDWKELSWEIELSTAGNNIYKASHTADHSENVRFDDDTAIIEVRNHRLEVGEVYCRLIFREEEQKNKFVIFPSGIYLTGTDGQDLSVTVEYDSQEGEINVPTDLQPINYKRSFSFTMYLKVGNNVIEGDAANWSAVFTTTGANYYECYHRNGILKNCVLEEDGSIRVLFEEHDLEVGVLWCEIGIINDDEDFVNGRRDNVVRVPTGLELVSGYDDIGIDLDLDIVMPYVYVDAYIMAKNAGFTGTREEYIESLVNLKDYIDKGGSMGGGGSSGSGGLDVNQLWAELRKKDNSKVIDDSHISVNIARSKDMAELREALLFKDIKG